MRCDGEPVIPGAGTTRANVVGVIARKAEWGLNSRIPSRPAVNMNDCINRPDRRLHQTPIVKKTSNHPLHRGSHPQKTLLATILEVAVAP